MASGYVLLVKTFCVYLRCKIMPVIIIYNGMVNCYSVHSHYVNSHGVNPQKCQCTKSSICGRMSASTMSIIMHYSVNLHNYKYMHVH